MIDKQPTTTIDITAAQAKLIYELMSRIPVALADPRFEDMVSVVAKVKRVMENMPQPAAKPA